MDGLMTADELKRIVLVLANHSHVRYWLHWNYPVVDPRIMAISVREPDCAPQKVDDLIHRGFWWIESERLHFIQRTDL